MKPTAEQEERLGRLAKKHRIGLILLFGSAVTGLRHSESDLDIAILLKKERDLSYSEYSELAQGLQEILGDCPVDLSLINHADPLFLKKITENCQILFGSPQRLQELKIYAFKRYQDHRRYFDMEQEYVKRFLKGTEVTP